MAIKNRDGSAYVFTKPVPQMVDQVFWNKKEKITMHNKFGMRYLRERTENDEVDLSRLKREVKLPNLDEITKPEIQTVPEIKEYKPKPLTEEVVDAWCLPCTKIIENHDQLYNEGYDKHEYGEVFSFKTKLLALEDLMIKFVTDAKYNMPEGSVVYPICASRRWWRIRGYKDVENGYRVYFGSISDYQPAFN